MKQLGGSGKASSSSSSSAEKLKDVPSPQPSIWKRFLFVDGLCSCRCCHFRVLHLQVQDSVLGCKLDGFGNKIYRLRDFYNLIYIYIINIEGKQPWAVMSSDVSQSSPFSAEMWGHHEHRQSESSKPCRFVPPGTCCVPMRLRMKQIRSSPSQWNLQDTGKVTVRWKSPCEHPKASRKTWHKTWVEGATSCAFVHQWTCIIDHTSVICHVSNSHNQGGPKCPCLWRELPCWFHAILSIWNHLK